MYYKWIFHFSIFITCAHSHVYHRYSGEILQDHELQKYMERHILHNCTIAVRQCAVHEGSRVDGTCYNFKHPSRGSAFGPYLRLLPPDYGNTKNGFGIRVDKNGKPLPSARKVRTSLQTTGRVLDKFIFNAAATTLFFLANRDMTVLAGSFDNLNDKFKCCDKNDQSDKRCAPIYVPKDDQLLRVADIGCLNFTRAETFQDVGCLPESHLPEQINLQTPVLDLSTIYGVTDTDSSSVRQGKNGLLKMQIRNSRHVPLDDAGNQTNGQNETIFYRFGYPKIGNFDLRTTSFLIFFMREHNRVARILKQINPCWMDDRIFKVARQINIATLQNIFLYELYPVILGKENMLKYNIISEKVQMLSGYNDDFIPLIFTEYDIAIRYFHTIIDGRIKMFKENYHYDGEFLLSDTLFRSILIEDGKNFENINRGSFYQRAAKVDDIEDPVIAEKFYGDLQNASDLIAIDIQRGRDLGIRGYNHYRKLCGFTIARDFHQLGDLIDSEKLEILMNLYNDVDDVDLLAGIMSEKFIQNTFVGPTLMCIISKQLRLIRYSDRFWFERGDQQHSLSLKQLHEIRRTSMARLACDNAEGIKFIQPHALLNVKKRNEPKACKDIPGPDYSKWKDESCNVHHQHYHYDLQGHLSNKKYHLD